jgi:hypothetical protein
MKAALASGLFYSRPGPSPAPIIFLFSSGSTDYLIIALGQDSHEISVKVSNDIQEVTNIPTKS